MEWICVPCESANLKLFSSHTFLTFSLSHQATTSENRRQFTSILQSTKSMPRWIHRRSRLHNGLWKHCKLQPWISGCSRMHVWCRTYVRVPQRTGSTKRWTTKLWKLFGPAIPHTYRTQKFGGQEVFHQKSEYSAFPLFLKSNWFSSSTSTFPYFALIMSKFLTLVN